MTVTVSDLTFVEVTAQAPEFELSHDVFAAVDLHDRPDTARPMALEDARMTFGDQPDSSRTRRWLVLDGEHPVAATELWTPLLDNLDLAYVEIAVLPEHRRRGIGSAALEHLEAVIRGLGRSLLSNDPIWPADEETCAGLEFALARGFTARNRELHRRLALPVDREMLLRLAAEAAEHHRDYRIIAFAEAVPDDILDSFAVLDALVDIESPTGDLEIEPDTPNPDAIRHNERLWRDQGRMMWGAVAVTADGEVVAMTQMIQRSGSPESIVQSGTIVRRDHRGHRLGMAVKAANLLQIETGDDVEYAGVVYEEVTTWNAASNTHMITVNDILGFEVIEQAEAMQKRLS